MPVLYATVMQLAGISVNLFWIGHYLGTTAVAAAANADTLLMLLYAVSVGVSNASAIRIGHCLGANASFEARRVVGSSVSLILAGSALLGSGMAVMAPALLDFVGTPFQVRGMSLGYLRVMLLGMPSFYIYAFLISALRATGDTKTPLTFMSLSVLLELMLNPLFIRGAGPLPPAGIAGAGIAALAAQTVGLAALTGYSYLRGHFLCLGRKELRLLWIDWNIGGSLLRNGIPITAQYCVISLQETLLLYLVNRYGVAVVAAYGASVQVWYYLQVPAWAIGVGVTIMAAQYLGAGRRDMLRVVIPIGIGCAMLITGTVAVVTDMLGGWAFRPFLNGDSAAIHIATHITREVAWSFALSSISATVFSAANADGTVWSPVAILFGVASTRLLVTDVALGRWHAEAIWWSFPIAAAITGGLAIAYYVHWSCSFQKG